MDIYYPYRFGILDLVKPMVEYCSQINKLFLSGDIDVLDISFDSDINKAVIKYVEKDSTNGKVKTSLINCETFESINCDKIQITSSSFLAREIRVIFPFKKNS